jgi:hypothetical protein
MPRLSAETILANLIAQRQEHLDALAEIDSLFAKYGMTLGQAKKKVGRKPGRKSGGKSGGGRRTRGHFDQTAEEFVLGLLQGGSLTTGAINAAWKKAGRKATANNTLTKLTKEKKVQRAKVKGGRGSSYSVK